MNSDILSHARRLSDTDLLAHVKRLAGHEREATAALVAHLAILDERRLFLREGFPSLFIYCLRELHLSEHAAYNRIEVARAARKFPRILPLLADGSVNLTAVRLLAPHLTPGNYADLLRAAHHKGKGDVEEIIAQLHPRPSAAASVRALPTTRTTSVDGAAPPQEPGATLTDLVGSAGDPPPPVPSPAEAAAAGGPPAAASIEPLGTQRYRVQFTATAEVRDKLALARDLLRHQIPSGDIGEIIDKALTLLLEHLARQKFAAAERPRSPSPRRSTSESPATRHIPAEVKRTVWLRDGGRCAFVARGGRRCEERGFLEFHHVLPHSAGGAASAENLELRCRAHNSYEAVLFFDRLHVSEPRTVWGHEPRPRVYRASGVGNRTSAGYGLTGAGKTHSRQILERCCDESGRPAGEVARTARADQSEVGPAH